MELIEAKASAMDKNMKMIYLRSIYSCFVSSRPKILTYHTRWLVCSLIMVVLASRVAV